MLRKRYKKPRLPKQPFMLVDLSGEHPLDYGVIDPSAIGDNGGNVFVYQRPESGSPLFIRVTRQQGDKLWLEDGEGKVREHEVRLV